MNKSEIAERAARGFFSRIVSHERAREAVNHFCNSHYRRQGTQPRTSIPANPDDDDIVLVDYITQQRAIAESQPQPRTKPDFAESAEVLLRHLAQATGEPTKQAIAEDALYRMWIGQCIDDYGEIAESQAPQPERCNDCLWLTCVPQQCSCECHKAGKSAGCSEGMCIFVAVKHGYCQTHHSIRSNTGHCRECSSRRGMNILETSRAFPAEAQRVIADPKATPEQLQKAYSQEIVMVTLSDKEYDKMYNEIELLKVMSQQAGRRYEAFTKWDLECGCMCAACVDVRKAMDKG